MSLSDHELLNVYQDLHHVFRDDLHVARPLIQMFQQQNEVKKAWELAMEMARRMLARGHPNNALGFLEICKRLDHSQTDDIESMISMAKMTLDSHRSSEQESFLLIDNLSDHEAMNFIRQGKLRHHSAGQIVVKQAEISNSFYIILQGKMNVHMQSIDGRSIHLTTLPSGSYFGEYACMYRLPRSASVTADKEVTLLEFSDNSVLQLMQQSPEAGKELMQVVQTRLVQSMSRTHPAFAEIAEADRDWLAEESTIIDLEEGTVLTSTILHHCCVVIYGKLTATRQTQEQPYRLDLGIGDMFGCGHKDLNLSVDTTATTNERCLICCIPIVIFQSFMTAYGPFEQWVKSHNDKHSQARYNHGAN